MSQWGRGSVVMALGAVAGLLAGCGGGGSSLDPQALGLPAGHGTTLATTTVATSPDGGIYRNPDHVEVTLVHHGNAALVASRLGGATSQWQPLNRLGAYTMVGMRVRDDGKVGSDPELNDLQVASDFAPAAADHEPLHHFYHPTYPLAAVSDATVNDDCSVHLDPGQSATVILLYPPLRPAATIVWGRFDGFALTLRTETGSIAASGTMHAAACSPPQVAPQ